MSFLPAELRAVRAIRSAAAAAIRFCTGMTRDGFVADQLVASAVLYRRIVIGEATKHLGAAFRQQYPDIPWRLMAGTRDRLVHGYWLVDLDLVWSTVTADLPDLIGRLPATPD